MSKLSERLNHVFRPDRHDDDWCLTLRPNDPLSALLRSARRSGGEHGAAPPSGPQQGIDRSADAMPDLREAAGSVRLGDQRTRGEDGQA